MNLFYFSVFYFEQLNAHNTLENVRDTSNYIMDIKTQIKQNEEMKDIKMSRSAC